MRFGGIYYPWPRAEVLIVLTQGRAENRLVAHNLLFYSVRSGELIAGAFIWVASTGRDAHRRGLPHQVHSAINDVIRISMTMEMVVSAGT
jgi:hypothetical protein